MKNTRIRRAGIGITGFATVLAAAALGAPDASAVIGTDNIVGGVGGDPSVYTITASLSGSPEDSTAQVFVYDLQTDATGTNTTTALLIGGVEHPDASGAVSVTWYPTTTGSHTIEIEERSATGQLLASGGFAQTVTQLPKSTGPAVTDPVGGSLTSNGVTINGEVFHPNDTYTLSASTASAPAGSLVTFYELGVDPTTGMNTPVSLGQATITNGVASVQWTPTKLGAHTIFASYGAPGASPYNEFAGQARMTVTSPPASSAGGSGSADSLPVIGNVLKSLGL